MKEVQGKVCTDPEILRRLSYVKYLFQLAVDQSNKPEPLGSFSILTFHDSVEMFLQLSAEYLCAKKSNDIKFMSYWKVINAELFDKYELSHEREMEKFNRARVNLKHFGNLIPRDDIAGHKIVVINFFNLNTITIFGIEFDNISLLEAVSSIKVKDILLDAKEYILKGDKREALIKVAYAYKILFEEYNKHPGSPWDFRMIAGDIIHISIGDKIDYKVKRLFFNLANAIVKSEEKIHKINDHIKLSELGINIEKHSKFKKLTPTILTFLSGKSESHFTHGYDIEDTEMKFCFDYVIECALLFQSKHEI